MSETMKVKKDTKSYPCTHCGWAMGEKEGKPICDHCKKTVIERELNE